MDYYLYISDSKLAMLYPQIKPKFWERLRGELGFSFVASAKVSVDGSSADTATSKLNSVIHELEKKQMIGTVKEPKEYFSGTMMMRSSTYTRGMLLYGGFDRGARTTVTLGGSSKHLVGNLPDEIEPDFHSGSDLDAILFHLGKFFAAHEVVDSGWIENNLGRFKNNKTDEQEPVWWARYATQNLNNESLDYKIIEKNNVLNFIAHSSNRDSEGKFIGGVMPRIRQKVKFVARNLLYELYGIQQKEKVLIGTPLYVALAD